MNSPRAISSRPGAAASKYVAVALVAGTIGAACVDIPTDADAVLVLEFNSLPSPSVVVGDTLRDSTGRVAPLQATAYNFDGDVVTGAQITYSSPDRGIRVDAVTGMVVADSLRTTPARIIASIGEIQATLRLETTRRPDTLVAVNGRDSLSYSLTDTTRNVSPALTVTLMHTGTQPDSAVRAFPVSFEILSPRDTLLAQLVDDGGRRSSLDTTDASGNAARKVFLRPARLTQLEDSVVVLATARYRGSHVRGSPVRLVLKVKPGGS